jgi:hypothetical protein
VKKAAPPPAPVKKGRKALLRLLRVLWRFAVGKHLDGKRRSDSTFFAAGTYAEPHYWGRGEESKWALLPGWKRAMFRWIPVLLLLGWWQWRTGTEWTLGIAGGVALGLMALYAIAAWRDFGHYRTKMLPLHHALAPVLDIPMATRPRTWLDVPRDYGERPDAEITVYPPPSFTASDRDKEDVTRAVTAKLGIEAPDADWSGLAGSKPRIIFTKSEPPPGYLEWPDVEAAVAGILADEVLFGLGKHRVPVAGSLAVDSPHVGLNSGSGGGKTNTASLCALQFLHRGDISAFIDAKLISYPWARGLPNVSYAGTIAEIHDLLVWLGGELDRRNKVSLAGLQPSGAIYANVGPRIVVFAEELNFLIPKLKRHWADLRAWDKMLPKRSPAIDAIGDLAFAGRQVHMHVFFIGQMLTAAATGSNDSSVRGNIGIALMARYTPQSWKAMSALAMPPVPTTPGRVQVVTAGGIRETQVPYLHLDDKNEAVATVAAQWAQKYATSGTLTVCPAGMPGATVQGVPVGRQLVRVGSEQPIVLGQGPVVPYPAGSATLREMADAGLFRTVDAARKAAQRNGFTVVGERDRANLYDLNEIRAHITGKRIR